jgi:predicted metal-binding membrane protein
MRAAPFPRPETATLLGWAAALGVGAAGWLALAAVHGPARLDWALFLELCAAPGAAPVLGALPGVALMWLLMGAAMMAPTAAPAVGDYARLVARDPLDPRPGPRLAGFLGGYLAVWSAFGLAAAGAQVALAQAGAAEGGAGLAGALLVAAGLWQRSALKAACLAACRAPMAFFLAHWREGARGGFAMGARHGALCVGCCWALMALMLGFGAMNLLWMAGLGAVMLAEKTLPGAARAARPLGAAAIAAGAALIATTAF